MNERRRTLGQIILILEKRLNGTKVKDICIKAGINIATFYRWEKQYRDVVQEYLEIKRENERLRKMFIDLSVMHDTLHETLVSVLSETQKPLPSHNQHLTLESYERIAI